MGLNLLLHRFLLLARHATVADGYAARMESRTFGGEDDQQRLRGKGNTKHERCAVGYQRLLPPS